MRRIYHSPLRVSSVQLAFKQFYSEFGESIDDWIGFKVAGRWRIGRWAGDLFLDEGDIRGRRC